MKLEITTTIRDATTKISYEYNDIDMVGTLMDRHVKLVNDLVEKMNIKDFVPITTVETKETQQN